MKKKSIICDLININEIGKINEEVYALYPNIGEDLDIIKINKFNQIKFLYRKIDQYSWKFCDKGFFNFKKKIPKIMREFS